MNTLTNLLGNPYFILEILIGIILFACMIYVHVSEKRDMKYKREHMHFDKVTGTWHYNKSN